MKRDQRGFTIVELLIAVAILSIVIAAVCGFILVGSRSYAAGNSDISVQQEAQLALNQMSDVMIDTTRSVNYAAYDAGGSAVLALKDAEFTFTPEDKSLIMYNGVLEGDPSDSTNQTVAAGNGNKHYHFYWSKTDETLYYTELDVDPANDVDINNIHFPDFDPTDPKWVVLAGHVTDFSVDLSQVEEKRVVQLALTFLDGTKEYVTSNNVTIRNKVGVNDVKLEPLNKKKTLSVTPRDSGVIIEPGETYHFSTPKVTGENVADRSVKWSVAAKSPSGGTQFVDVDNGILEVAGDEPGGKIDVTITTNAVDSDGHPASATFQVDIKRVTAVNLSKTSDTDSANDPNEISPGCTFTISADVTGHKLGEVCSVCGDDTSVDKWVVYDNMGYTCRPNVHGRPLYWYIHNPSVDGDGSSNWDPTKYIEIIDQAADHATFRVKADAPTTIEGDPIHTYGVVIQAAAFLPEYPNKENRDYGMVGGAIELKIAKGKKNIYVTGNLRWGQGVKVGIDNPPDFNKSGQGYYLICARIREYGAEGGEKIMIYKTLGNESWVTPDLFGVADISKPWYLSLQAIDPGQHFQPGVCASNQPNQNLQQKVNEQIHDQVVLDAIDDYLHNCDASGTYIGTKYPHTDKYEGMINPPEIFYYYNGQSNLGGELYLNKAVSLLQDNGSLETKFGVDYVKNTKGNNEYGGGVEFANNNVKFSLYKEKSGGGLEKLFWYDPVNNNYQGNSSLYDGTLQVNDIQNARNALIKLDYNKKYMFSQAAGKYRLIPTIWYAQNPQTDHSYDIYYVDYEPNYGTKQYYEVPESTVYYEMVNGGNLKLWSYYKENNNNQNDSGFTLGDIYFPTPSESGFSKYFDRGNSGWQNAKLLERFVKSIDGKNNTTYFMPSSMRCHYMAGSNEYELELFYDYYDSVWDRTGKVSAGVYKCAADGNKWTQISKGTLDSELNKNNMYPQLGHTATMEFTMWGNNIRWNMYIPLPSEDAFTHTYDNNKGFGFKLKQSGEQSIDNRNLKYQNIGETGTRDFSFTRVSCTYDAAKGEYTLVLYGSQNDSYTFTCKSDGTRWTRTK